MIQIEIPGREEPLVIDVLVRSGKDALDLLLKPDRLRATLRN